MKLSKSILIFLFFSSFSGAFFYAMRRTKGNSFKSLLFALYFLAIQIGLIAPNVPLKLNQNQPKPNQQLVSTVYNPHVSIFDQYGPFGLDMDKIQQPVPQHYLSYHSQSAIGDSRGCNNKVWAFSR